MPTTTIASKIPQAKNFPKPQMLNGYRRATPSPEQPRPFRDKIANVWISGAIWRPLDYMVGKNIVQDATHGFMICPFQGTNK